MIHAKPNLNGDTAETFTNKAIKINTLVGQLEEELLSLKADVFHARNYQTHEDAVAKRNADIAELQAVMDNVNSVYELSLAIYLKSD